MRKKELRSLYLQKRTELDRGEAEKRSHRICNRFFASVSLHNVQVLHAFLPAVSKKEVNTRLIIDEIWKKYPSVTVAAPVCDFSTGKLLSCLLSPNTLVEENKWGIPEPKQEYWLTAEKIDMVLTPLLVADQYGNRVGYGKGFYDRFFMTCRKDVQKIGLSVFEPIDCIPDVESTDVPLDALITPDNCYFFDHKQN